MRILVVEDFDLLRDSLVKGLSEAGFAVEAVSSDEDLSDVFEGFNRDMSEYDVSRDGQSVRLQLVRFERRHSPVQMDIGPVLNLDDLLGSKVAALATRAEIRDFLDVAEALRRYPREHLITLAHDADPDLTDAEIADAMRYLDELDDRMFVKIRGLTPNQIRKVRAAFSDWPR